MQLDMQSLMRLLGETLRQPEMVAERLKPDYVPRKILWMAIVILSVLSAILGTISSGSLIAAPFGMALMTLGLLVITIFGSQLICGWFGGTGTLDQAMYLLSWQHFVVLCLQTIGFILSLALAPIAGAITLAIGLIAFWQMAVFIKVLHDFTSIGRVIGGMLGFYFIFAFVVLMFIAPSA